MKKEFCIMPKSPFYHTRRTSFFNERHEVFFGTANREKSIEDGMIVFLSSEGHRGTNGVHGKNGDKFNAYLKQKGQQAWQEYYRKTEEDFIARYGKNYLD